VDVRLGRISERDPNVPYLLNEDAATSLVHDSLERYGIAPCEAHLELIKYRENFVYRVRCGDKDYALRLHRPGHRTDAALRAELELLDAIGADGLKVPAVVSTTDGELLCCLETADGEHIQIDAQGWIDGSSPMGSIEEGFAGTSRLEPSAFRQLGTAIAQLHNAAADHGGRASAVRGAWDAEGLAGRHPLWGDPLDIPELGLEDARILNDALEKLFAELDHFGTSGDRYGVIHADFTPENVLVQGVELVLIDFDDYGNGWYLFDLVTVVFFFLPHPRYEEYVSELLAGYRKERALPESHLEFWHALMFARATTYLGWAGERRGDPDAEFIVSDVVPIVLQLAGAFLRSPIGGNEPGPPVRSTAPAPYSR
jgi:Ser/Thr protein kinase RdoA (MazF antagonist)